jgi:hypothetical protein
LEGIKGSYEDYWKTFPLELRADTGSVKDPDIVHTGTTAADVLDSTKAILRKGREGQPVAYRYDTDLRSRSASPSLPQSEARTSDEFRADFGMVEVPPGQSAFIATLSEPKAASVLTPFVQGVADALFVSVDKLPVPTDEELRNAVELVLRVSEGDATTAPSTIVGTLSFFDMHDARGNASHDHVTALTQLSRAFLVEVSDVFDNPRRAPSGPLRITGTLRVKKGIPEPAGWSAFRAEWRLLVRDPASALEVTLVATR